MSQESLDWHNVKTLRAKLKQITDALGLEEGATAGEILGALGVVEIKMKYGPTQYLHGAHMVSSYSNDQYKFAMHDGTFRYFKVEAVDEVVCRLPREAVTA